jgi:putative hydrolase of the HAD superfamily
VECEASDFLAEVTALFFDIGGVLLTNGWDRDSRVEASAQFHLDWNDFEVRHEAVLEAFETGKLGLEQYLDRVIFYRARDFTREQFKKFMYGQAKAMPESLAFMRRLTRKPRKVLISSLNNESRDLNEYRIEKFGLREYFDVFLSSCYLGARKPDAEIYKLALSITQRRSEETIFVDDRLANLEPARALGMTTIQFEAVTQLERELKKCGIEISPA